VGYAACRKKLVILKTWNPKDQSKRQSSD